MLWGALLTILSWLAFLASRGGVPQANTWVYVVFLAVFAYIGYTAYKVSKSFAQAMLTATLSGLVEGILGVLTVYLTPGTSLLAGAVVVLVNGFATAIFAGALGAMGATWFRIRSSFARSK